ncbi:hypothetical protein OGZ51_07025 [Lactococcus lactis]|uniref:Uncharacterized protein n=1 Tax=Lactococcus lactis TaxID=1358 RepID=A0A9X4NI82_9LACT|nr:hypothetical protein [Lactococcus lactis]MDG4983892.1 hypothetical protein [Lactococcus lactis]
MIKKIFLNTLGVIAIILLVIVQIGANFVQTRYQLTYLSPWIPVIINSCIILFLGFLVLFNFTHAKKYRYLVSGLTLLCLIIFVGYSSQTKAIKANNNIYSLSPNKRDIFCLKKDGEKLTYYQSYYLLFGKMREVLPYNVAKVGNPTWITDDVAAVTYQDTEGHLHIYLGTYGHRGSSISYNYATSLTRGKWENSKAKFSLSNILGDLKITDNGKTTNYSSDNIVQFGTSGVVLTDENSAKYAYVIPEEARYESDGTPKNLQDIKLLSTKPNLKEMKVLKLSYKEGEK